MTFEEARDILYLMMQLTPEEAAAVNIAGRAIGRQIKIPIRLVETEDNLFIYCPTCDHSMERFSSYCPRCGQAMSKQPLVDLFNKLLAEDEGL